MKILVASTALLMIVASPAFGQSFYPGHWAADGYGAPNYGAAHMNWRPGERAYAMRSTGRVNPNSPALTGGGSVGYNEAPLNS